MSFTVKLLTLIFVSILLSASFAYSALEEGNSTSIETTKDGRVPKQAATISLINTLLKQTSVLNSVDGILVAVTTLMASLISRAKPLIVTSAMSYFMYVGASMMIPGPLARMGLPVLDLSVHIQHGASARSVDGRAFEGVFGETVTKSLRFVPVMNVVTNVSVSIVSDTMARLRSISRMFVSQLSSFQSNMSWFTRALSNECVSRFMCRVGQVTDTNFPMAASLLRTVAETYPGMDVFAVAVVRGTSSSNCSLIYPDCTLP